jgi:oxygen-independent coproporphyrinogen-3 oxidase
MGVSSISSLGTAYAQNVKKLGDYYRALDGEKPLLEKGINLTQEDIVHRGIINQLMCNFYVNKSDFASKYDIDFDSFFADNIKQLASFENDNLVTNNEDSITIHPRGRLLVRNICMSFDQYLVTPAHQLRYSRVI